MQKTIITCAVTGNHTTVEQHPGLPVSPAQIAQSSLEAAAAGAAIVHIHVREPNGTPSMNVDYYVETVDRIRERNSDLIINLTTGPGGRYHPSDENPAVAGPRTNLLIPERRLEHVAAIKPDIATLDLNTMTFGREVVINTPRNVAIMANIMNDLGVKPELELFDSGDIALFHDLIKNGHLKEPHMCSIVMGVKYGFQASTETVLYARDLLPGNTTWTAFGTGRWSFPMVAQAFLAGGNVRVGLEDGVKVARDELAPSNAALVEKARRIVEDLSGVIATPVEARKILSL